MGAFAITARSAILNSKAGIAKVNSSFGLLKILPFIRLGKLNFVDS